jgi:GT2 family glycosyltransferase
VRRAITGTKTSSTSQGKSAIITVTYNEIPDLKVFEDAAQLVDYVILCDNSTDSQTVLHLQKFCDRNPKCILLKNNINLGISKAYNKAVAFAENLGVFWLYFFDDDAQFDLNWIRMARCSWEELERLGSRVGILAPIVSNNRQYLSSRLGMRTDFAKITSIITSGVFTNVDIFNQCGGYNPEFFVDWADLEFARRVQRCGYSVIRLNTVLVFQDFGQSLDNSNLRNRLINAYIKFSSLLSLKLNKSNTFSTSYSVYSTSRYNDQRTNALGSMKHSGIRNLSFRLFLILVHHVVLPQILRKEILLNDG